MGGEGVDITQLLHRWQSGDQVAEARLFELLLPQLHAIAVRFLRHEHNGQTEQPTALVNEAFLRLAAIKKIDWHDRGHFLALAARVMRRCLIDIARSRPDANVLNLEGIPEYVLCKQTKLECVIAIDELLDRMAVENPRRSAVVDLKFFLGLTDTEAADALNLSLHTFQREWYRARRWLFEQLRVQ